MNFTLEEWIIISLWGFSWRHGMFPRLCSLEKYLMAIVSHILPPFLCPSHPMILDYSSFFCPLFSSFGILFYLSQVLHSLLYIKLNTSKWSQVSSVCRGAKDSFKPLSGGTRTWCYTRNPPPPHPRPQKCTSAGTGKKWVHVELGKGKRWTSAHQRISVVDWANIPDPWGKVSGQMSYHLTVNTNNSKETLCLKI